MADVSTSNEIGALPVVITASPRFVTCSQISASLLVEPPTLAMLGDIKLAAADLLSVGPLLREDEA
jgi:hypothetical protein